MKLSIVIPAHNEQANILEAIEKAQESVGLPFELIVVNDHSQDLTEDIVKKAITSYNNVRLVQNELPRGFANALRTGFMHISGDAVVPVMADLCDDLKSIRPMYDKIQEGFALYADPVILRVVRGSAALRLRDFFPCWQAGHCGIFWVCPRMT